MWKNELEEGYEHSKQKVSAVEPRKKKEDSWLDNRRGKAREKKVML